MATGYTYPVKDGKVADFKTFALSCARAFGALIEMRDSSPEAPIPDDFKPTDYHAKNLETAKAELARLRAMTPTERAAAYGAARAKPRIDPACCRARQRPYGQKESEMKYRTAILAALASLIPAWGPLPIDRGNATSPVLRVSFPPDDGAPWHILPRDGSRLGLVSEVAYIGWVPTPTNMLDLTFVAPAGMENTVTRLTLEMSGLRAIQSADQPYAATTAYIQIDGSQKVRIVALNASPVGVTVSGSLAEWGLRECPRTVLVHLYIECTAQGTTTVMLDDASLASNLPRKAQ